MIYSPDILRWRYRICRILLGVSCYSRLLREILHVRYKDARTNFVILDFWIGHHSGQYGNHFKSVNVNLPVPVPIWLLFLSIIGKFSYIDLSVFLWGNRTRTDVFNFWDFSLPVLNYRYLRYGTASNWTIFLFSFRWPCQKNEPRESWNRQESTSV